MVYTVISLSLIDAKPSPTAAQCSVWSLALVFEIFRLSAFLVFYGHPGPMNGWLVGEVLINALRVVLLLGLVSFYALFSLPGRSASAAETHDESASLLRANGSAAR